MGNCMSWRTIFHELYEILDQDDSGSISSEEVVRALKALCKDIDPQTLKELQDQGISKLSFMQFTEIMRKHILGNLHQNMDKFKIFMSCDDDHNGNLERPQVVELLKKLNRCHTEADVDAVMTQCDASGDGRLSFYEFLEYMEKHPTK